MKKQALISVSDKTGVAEFAKNLERLGYSILSTGGTLQTIKDAQVPVTPVDEVTKFPEMLDGRVKTLHPNVHGGLLAKRDNPAHMEALKENSIKPIDLVVVNLYPFKETLKNENSTHEEKIENIDIGGPTMLRAAAKNYEDVVVVVDPTDYKGIIQELESGDVSLVTKERLAAKVFRHTAEYDALIASYFNERTAEKYPVDYTVTYEKVQDLRYGENPHQTAAFYKSAFDVPYSLASSKQLHGKDLSYNNIQDANAALEIVREYTDPTAVAVKHMNPCGIGTGSTIATAFERAYEADPTSIFGGIIALNREVDLVTANHLSEIFLEIVIAPSFKEDALEKLKEKPNIRLLITDMNKTDTTDQKITSVTGGVLIQDADTLETTEADLEVVTERKPSKEEIADLLFGWKAVKHVKSNAIVLSKAGQTIGVGAGQMNRVGAAKIAIEQAGDKARGSALASDAFFPMPDTVEAAHAAGVTAIIQPGGSKRDQESIDYCNKHGIAMVFTQRRHFKH